MSKETSKAKKEVKKRPYRKRKYPKEKKYVCEVCGIKFYFPNKLRDHSYIHTDARPFKCTHCDKAFNSTYSLKTHMYIHSNEKPYSCSFCPYACRDSSTLRKHEHNKHMGIKKIYQCKLCEKSFSLKTGLKMHVAETHLQLDVRTKQCQQCDKRFKTTQQLTCHVKNVHSEVRRAKCPICDKVLSNVNNMRLHLQTHVERRKTLVCDVAGCNKRFMYQSGLRYHRMNHFPEQKLPCPQCDRMFSRQSRLNRHFAVIHAERIRPICDYCGVSFISKAYLVNHIQRKHSKKRKKYICDMCGLKTTNKPSIVMHIKYGHVSESDRKCKICHTVYKKHAYLKQHYLKTHNVSYKTKKKPPKPPTPPPKIKEEIVLDDQPIDLFEIEKEEFELLEQTSNLIEENRNIVRNYASLRAVPNEVFDRFYVDMYTKTHTNDDEEPLSRSKYKIDHKERQLQKKEIANLLKEVRRKETVEALERARQIYNERLKDIVVESGSKDRNPDIIPWKKTKDKTKTKNQSNIKNVANNDEVSLQRKEVIRQNTEASTPTNEVITLNPKDSPRSNEETTLNVADSTQINEVIALSEEVSQQSNEGITQTKEVFLRNENLNKQNKEIISKRNENNSERKVVKRQKKTKGKQKNKKVSYSKKITNIKSKKRLYSENKNYDKVTVTHKENTKESVKISSKNDKAIITQSADVSPRSHEVITQNEDAMSPINEVDIQSNELIIQNNEDNAQSYEGSTQSYQGNIQSYEVNEQDNEDNAQNNVVSTESIETTPQSSGIILQRMEVISLNEILAIKENPLAIHQEKSKDVKKYNKERSYSKKVVNINEGTVERNEDSLLRDNITALDDDATSQSSEVISLNEILSRKENPLAGDLKKTKDEKKPKKLLYVRNVDSIEDEDTLQLEKKSRQNTDLSPCSDEELNSQDTKINTPNESETTQNVGTTSENDGFASPSSKDVADNSDITYELPTESDEVGLQNDTDATHRIAFTTNVTSESNESVLKSNGSKVTTNIAFESNETVLESEDSLRNDEVLSKSDEVTKEYNADVDNCNSCYKRSRRKIKSVNYKELANGVDDDDEDYVVISKDKNNMKIKKGKSNTRENKDKINQGKVNFNMHQCYVCFKLYETKEQLIEHCKIHFDNCSEKFLKKCPLCEYVSSNSLPRHMRLVHKISIKLPYKIHSENGKRFYLKLNNPQVSEIEVIPSIKNLNKMASNKIDADKRKEKLKKVTKTKLVKKGKEWIVENERVAVSAEMLPELDVNAVKDAKDVKASDDNSYFDSLKKLYQASKKNGKTMMFPCQHCEKVCQNMAALKLHYRKHDPNAKPFAKKVWKHKLNSNSEQAADKATKIYTKNKNLNFNRIAKPKPIKNNHKCDKELQEFYKNNIRGGDIEFWQFLKIFNKMDRDNINDFKDLNGRYDYGVGHHMGEEDDEASNKNGEKNDQKVTTYDSAKGETSNTVNKQKKHLNVSKNVHNNKIRLNSNSKGRLLGISNKLHLKREQIRKQLREKLAMTSNS